MSKTKLSAMGIIVVGKGDGAPSNPSELLEVIIEESARMKHYLEILDGKLPCGDDHLKNCLDEFSGSMLVSLSQFILKNLGDSVKLTEALQKANEFFVQQYQEANKALSTSDKLDDDALVELKDKVDKASFIAENHIMLIIELQRKGSLYEALQGLNGVIKKMRADISEELQRFQNVQELMMECESDSKH